MIGMFGGILGSQVISSFEAEISAIPALAFFIPLITAMGGNVGVQSSAIVVQSLARDNFMFKSTLTRIAKEVMVALTNGILLSLLIYAISSFLEGTTLAIVVSISLFIVIIFASVLGTIIPLALNKYNIDPALATGPFVTTLNDIIGLFIYFTVGMFLYHL